MSLKVIPTRLPGVVLIEPEVFYDERGFFFESYQQQKFRAAGIDATFVQDNHSCSVFNTLRGLHLQRNHPQGKLVRVIEGTIYDVAVDVRRGSATFGHWVSATLSAENKRLLYLPPNFAHGFYVVSETAQVEYKCTDYYDAASELCIHWNDPMLKIDWPCVGLPKQSPKDQAGKTITEIMEELPIF